MELDVLLMCLFKVQGKPYIYQAIKMHKKQKRAITYNLVLFKCDFSFE